MIKISSLSSNINLLKVLICFWLISFSVASFSTVVQGELLAKSSKAKRNKKKSVVKRTNLPDIETLLSYKYGALKQKQAEQEQELANILVSLEKENDIKEQIFDKFSYIQLNFVNNVSPREFRLDSLKLFIDSESTPFYEIGPYKKQNPQLDPLYFGKISQGCHTITAKAVYTRLTNNLIRSFFVNRHEEIVKQQTFVAKNGYQLHMDIEFFRESHTIVSAYKNPYLRFNNLVRPNFLQTAPLVSLQEAINQGRLRLSYSNEDSQNYEIKSKSISIDGLLIVNTKNNNDESLLYDAPLRNGKHTLNVSLVMGPKKVVKGGSSYNFELSFKRDFYIVSGQTTAVDLLTLPKSGLSKNRTKTTYARVTSEVFSEENSEFFPFMSCSDLENLKNKKVEDQSIAIEQQPSKLTIENKPIDEQVSPESSSSEAPVEDSNLKKDEVSNEVENSDNKDKVN